jgi:group I intron endonuclease
MSAGIYTITNSLNGKVYVGSSANVEHRWRQHRCDLRLGRHKNPALQSAWRKYGSEAFIFQLVEVVESATDLVGREQHFIDTIMAAVTGYNVCKVAGRERAGVPHAPESIEKMRAAHRGKTISESHRAALSDAFKGRQFSAETREKIAQAKTGSRRPPASDEARANIARGQQLRSGVSAKSGLRGAYLEPGNRWVAKIGVNGKSIHLGTFDSAQSAHEAYMAAKAKYHTQPKDGVHE